MTEPAPEYDGNTFVVPEPTDDNTPDGSQIPTADDLPDEEGDAGVGDVDLEDDAVLLSELPD